MLAKGGEAKFLLAELYGKATGYCHGKGGSMHVATIEHGMIGANAIIGANSPMVGGAALGFQMMGSSRVAVSFVGDGAIDTGGLHEALSLAALWNVPAIFVLENNGFTEFVARKDLQRAETIVGRAAAYGIPAISVNGNDVEEVALQARLAIDRARSGEGPTFIEATTYRLRGHFVGDPELYRTPEEVEEHRAGEPLVLAEQKLRERGVIDDQLVSDILKEVSETVDEAVQFAEESPYPDPEDALDGVYTNLSVTGWEQQT